MRTYSLSNPKGYYERWNSHTQVEVAKKECNLTNPLIQNQQVESEFQINVENILQFNQNLNGSELMEFNRDLKSNSEIAQKEDDQQYCKYDRNYESHNTDIIVLATPPQKQAQSCWKHVLGLWRLQQNVVEPITSTEQFYDNFGSTQRHINTKMLIKGPSSYGFSGNAIDGPFQLIQIGSNEDIQNMIKILQRDPKRNLTNPQDPNHIINSLNQYGQNALYIASKNGNAQVIKFLLSLECNTHIRSRIFEDLTESPLEVSSRWHHLECVRLLLAADKYSNAELRSATKATQNQEIINMLKRNMSSSLFSCCL